PVLPGSAPIAPERVLWVNGLLAGRYSRVPAAAPAVVVAAQDAAGPAINVLWASQTGNAEDFAGVVGRRLTEAGWQASVRSMADVGVDALTGLNEGSADLLIIT